MDQAKTSGAYTTRFRLRSTRVEILPNYCNNLKAKNVESQLEGLLGLAGETPQLKFKDLKIACSNKHLIHPANLRLLDSPKTSGNFSGLCSPLGSEET